MKRTAKAGKYKGKDEAVKSKPAREPSNKKVNVALSLMIGLAVGVSGYLLITTQAAGFFASVEPDTGTLSGNAKVITDSSAYGGKAIQFTAPSTTPPPTPGGGACNLSATTSNFASQITAATAGQTICLADGNYGTWAGTNKAIYIKASGSNAQMKFSFSSGDSSFTLDGMKGMGGTVGGSAANITVKNSQFTSQLTIGPNGGGIVFDGNTHNNISGNSTAQRILTEGPVTIQNSHLEGGGSDGVRIASSARVNVLNNTFLNIIEDGPNHTDMIQWCCGSSGSANAVVRGNLFKQTISGSTQVMGAFDGTGGNLIEDNVVDVTSRNWGVELYADNGSIVRHNTFVYHATCDYGDPCGFITLDHKSADPAGHNTQVYDNIATAVLLENGSTASRRDHNMVRQNAGSGDFTGTPVFVGGANPSTYAGYRLAAGSPGKAKASDGLDVGIH